MTRHLDSIVLDTAAIRRKKNWLLASSLSRSLKVIGVSCARIDRLPVTSYWWSMITMGLYRTLSEINDDFGWKTQIFPTSVYSTSPLREFHLEFCNGGSAKKTRVMPVPDNGKTLTISAFVYIQYQNVTDRRTDRFAENNIALCRHRMLTRDNNKSHYLVQCINHKQSVMGINCLKSSLTTATFSTTL